MYASWEENTNENKLVFPFGLPRINSGMQKILTTNECVKTSFLQIPWQKNRFTRNEVQKYNGRHRIGIRSRERKWNRQIVIVIKMIKNSKIFGSCRTEIYVKWIIRLSHLNFCFKRQCEKKISGNPRLMQVEGFHRLILDQWGFIFYTFV